MSNPKFMLGYDYQWLSEHGDKLPVFAPIDHTIVVGGSGSGKSTSVLYWLYKLKKYNCELYIADFKNQAILLVSPRTLLNLKKPTI